MPLQALQPPLKTWHHCMGHIGVFTIKSMATRGMATGMPVDFSETPPSCPSCILGKQKKTPVPKESVNGRSKRKLGVICADLTGAQAVESKRHNRYSLTLVDKYTDTTWSIPVKTKSQAAIEVVRWEREQELETGLKVGIYRIDGGELNSNKFRRHLMQDGTKLQITAPHTSAQNGIVEHQHLTIFQLARSMRAACSAPANLWDYFVKTATYIADQPPTTYQCRKTPFKAYHNQKPNLSHLREIGC